MKRDIQAVLSPDGTAELTGIALVPRPPFVGPAVDALFAQLQKQAASGHLLVMFSNGLLPPEPWRVRLADVAASAKEVRMVDGSIEIVAKLLTTPRGGQVYRVLHTMLEAKLPSGLMFTTCALGSTDKGVANPNDVHLVSVHLVGTDQLKDEEPA